MSYNWENDVWQDPSGLWHRGFWARITGCGAGSDEDYDSEWDDEFSSDTFAYYQGGFRTEAEACRWEPGGNPGHVNVWSKPPDEVLVQFTAAAERYEESRRRLNSQMGRR